MGRRIVTVFLVAGLLLMHAATGWAGEDVWHKLALDKTHVISIVSDPVRPSTLYAATSRGVLKSSDNGAGWSPLNQGLPGEQPPSCVAVNPFNSKVLYAGYDGLGIFQSMDGGVTWQAINEGLPNLYVRCITVSPKDSNLIYAGIQGGVVLSTNGGKAWHMSSGFRRATNVNTIVIDPKNPQYLFAGTGGSGVFKSGNGGVSWKDINQGLSSLSILTLYIDPENPDRVLAGSYHPATPTDLYVGEAVGGVYQTVDGGRTWHGTNLVGVTVFSLAGNPQHPGVLYAGAWGGAFRSVDGGENWTDINAGLDNAFVHKVHIVPDRMPTVLAGTTYGILSYTDTQVLDLLKGQRSTPWLIYGLAGVGCLLTLIGIGLWRKKKRKSADGNQSVW
ncbi:WD40/YVTN/BNR-like repeat-containing protein [Sporomusa acidovorans]|uniref:Ycf48-like protein n=1 Tax=Sporomusa acidovorans (strain ATCC 49682 / DSM 3132 / Mol) TaxID=1123286 RepID=A0ABZ3J9N5_SPOA4|nr:hypothetical protein [Sporomusa acidovorans]OZC21783.1 xyloglucanase Xgh74A precursor [Sporomusa acidovorans DSM 3132]SDD56967.1 hypothetical protein SAMN04488499_100275 [Sporomusa acidovorans]